MTYDGHAFAKYGWGGGSIYHEPDVPSVLCTVSHITLMEVLKNESDTSNYFYH